MALCGGLASEDLSQDKLRNDDDFENGIDI
jgi:hypothetical protein